MNKGKPQHSASESSECGGPANWLILGVWWLGFKVGAYLKTPRYPIWLLCSESHFSVLFGLQRELLASQDQFDLYYYDGLANQQEEIRLTVCKPVPLLITTLLLS